MATAARFVTTVMLAMVLTLALTPSVCRGEIDDLAVEMVAQDAIPVSANFGATGDGIRRTLITDQSPLSARTRSRRHLGKRSLLARRLSDATCGSVTRTVPDGIKLKECKSKDDVNGDCHLSLIHI